VSARSGLVLGYGLGFATAAVIVAPLLAPFGIYAYEEYLRRHQCVPVKAKG
jgi:hypothetical protein